jgi:hypothetical protein
LLRSVQITQHSHKMALAFYRVVIFFPCTISIAQESGHNSDPRSFLQLVPKLLGPCAFKRSVKSYHLLAVSYKPALSISPKVVGLTSPSRKHSIRAERLQARVSRAERSTTKVHQVALSPSQRKSQVHQVVAQKNQGPSSPSPFPATRHPHLVDTHAKARTQ